jgi:uncharacterized damage-inducible protein DinB
MGGDADQSGRTRLSPQWTADRSNRSASTEGADLLKALDKSAEAARAAFEKTSDEHLKTDWKLLARGKVVMQAPRYEMIADTLSHWSHHRGQMTVYLRLMGQKVPAIFGPSADDNQFL